MSIECPNCSSFNASGALHCDQCGSPLAGGGRASSKGVPPLVVLLIAILVGGGAFVYLRGGGDASSPLDGDSSPESPRPQTSPPVARSGGGRAGTQDLTEPAGELLAQDATVSSGKLVAGWLQLEDPHGVVIDRIATAATREGWLAVPRLAALGSSVWVFRPGLGGETRVVDGISARVDAMGLWRIESPDLAAAPPLRAWVEAEPVTFISFSANRREEFTPPPQLRRDGLFLRAESPFELGSGGVLMQEGAIVGWGSGPPESSLWFWNSDAGSELDAERTVLEFYQETFVGGREEAISAAHAAAETPASRLSVLHSYAAAFRLSPRLRDEESRERWQPASAIGPVARAMRELLDGGAPGSILEAMDLSMVRLLGDAAVFLLWVDAVAEIEGAAAAIALLDRWGSELVPVGSDLEEQLVARLLTFTRDALRLALDQGDFALAWGWVEDGRRRFPDDPDLYLSEVELWVGEGDWRRAEELITAVSFPATFRERVSRLERMISDLKGSEGKIVIRFRPGASAITTHADIGGVEQLFIVDTGASYTSIPWSTVNALGIRIDDNTPRRELRTASDVISVPVVVLPEVTLGGWTIHNVTATVIDLPGNESLGLLGLNFLGKFEIGLDREQGRMTLAPK